MHLLFSALFYHYFNSRPSARGDLIPRSGFSAPRISIHAPPRGATRVAQTGVAVKRFQFTPLREGRLPRIDEKGATMRFQFTPLREGRRMQRKRHRVYRRISIHAPPRGATCLDELLSNDQDISIHAHPRGATGFMRCHQRNTMRFQFTPLREGRP